MVKQLLLLTALLLCCLPLCRAQTSTDDRTLFTVDGKPVTVGEFVYIYTKTNADQADFSEPSLREYLDLYTKFKLKVARAREMRLDTIKILQEELAGYRRQLADSYLTDRAITDPLAQELYERIQRDVDLSHILITVASDAAPADTLAAYRRIASVKSQIEAGKFDFAAAAQEFSADRFSAERGGRVGYLTAPLPDGLYNLETVAYTATPGQLVGPIRTKLGYHLVQVNGSRPARGEIEAAHILVRTEDRPEGMVIARIDSIYQALENGADFRALAARTSEDARTAEKGGYIGFFGINRFEKAFEDAAFALDNDGDYSRPVRSQVGFHIIQRISRKGIQPFNLERPQLERKVKADTRFAIARRQMLERIKQRADFRQREPVLDRFVASLTDTFRNFRWTAPEPSPQVLFEMNNDFRVTQGDFTNWLQNHSRERLAAGRSQSPQQAARELYATFVEEQVLRYEENQLEKNYPDFAALMREYEEGILLFEATKLEVWDKASQDSVGLAKFFADHRAEYRWDERARTTVFLVGLKYEDQLPAIRAYAMGHDAAAVQERFNTDGNVVVSLDEATYERERIPELRDAPWEVGTVTEATTNRSSGGATFYKIETILPPAPKALDEARGYVIADYQDQLERDWIEELSHRFKVKVNKKVFESLIAQ
jgi:peptidyl-prolyl cis-trans isomerase SurA